LWLPVYATQHQGLEIFNRSDLPIAPGQGQTKRRSRFHRMIFGQPVPAIVRRVSIVCLLINLAATDNADVGDIADMADFSTAVFGD
jgi:hypothetical protein